MNDLRPTADQIICVLLNRRIGNMRDTENIPAPSEKRLSRARSVFGSYSPMASGLAALRFGVAFGLPQLP
jgi:hypothetical protein